MSDSSNTSQNDDFNEADSRADAIAAFCLVLILACTGIYIAAGGAS